MTDSTKLDTYLTQYCEQTRETENINIDVNLFKLISFQTGVPLIIVDLAMYLTGGINNKQIGELVVKALTLLYDRVPPVHIKDEPVSATPLYAKKPFLARVQQGLKEMVREKVPRVRKLIPPLKDVPDEIYDDSGNDSDYKISRLETESQIKLIFKELGEA